MQPDNTERKADEQMPAAPTGNASNPSAGDILDTNNQLLDARAEQYLRESASIEDLPDDQDWQDAHDQQEQP